MSERFFVSVIGTGDTIELTGDEAHHLARVSRIGCGERVHLFDGSGIECEAVVTAIGTRAVKLSVLSRQAVSRELPFSLTLGCAPLQGDRLRWLVEKATEMGVTRFVPILTSRATEATRWIKAEKMRRWVIEASKQCGRNVLMELADAVTCTEFLGRVTDSGPRLLADPAGTALGSVLRLDPTESVTLAVGPEGGFTGDELQLARTHGWTLTGLGPRILRVETAALVIMAQIASFRCLGRDADAIGK